MVDIEEIVVIVVVVVFDIVVEVVVGIVDIVVVGYVICNCGVVVRSNFSFYVVRICV